MTGLLGGGWFAGAGLVGAGVGLLAGCGLVIAGSRLPALRMPSLDDRLAPYLRDSTPPSRLLARDRTVTPFPTMERLLAPLMADAVRRLERFLGGAASARRRLDQAGRDVTLDEFRSEQVVWATGGLCIGLGISLVVGARGSFSPVLLLFLSLSGAVAGLLARDQLLSWEVSQREQRIMTGVKASPECAFLCTYVTSPLRRNLVWMIQSSLLGVRRRLGSSAIGMFSVHRKSRRCVCGPSNNAHPTTPASARHRRPRSLTGFCDAPSSAA